MGRKLGPKGAVGLSDLYSQYKRNAKVKQREFSLSKEEFRTLTSSNCSYCGIPPFSIWVVHRERSETVIENEKYIYNGIDRIDNALGYILENSITCCKYCNIAKHDRSYRDYLDWVRRSYEHQKEKHERVE